MNKKINILVLVLLVTSLFVGLVANYFYTTSPSRVVDVRHFTTILRKKQHVADNMLSVLNTKRNIDLSKLFADTLNSQSCISYYLYRDDELVGWSDNQLCIDQLKKSHSDTTWHYERLTNAHCVVRQTIFGNYRWVCCVLIKHHYPYENDELSNEYAPDFNLPKEVQIRVGKINDKFSIKSIDGNYLFSLSPPKQSLYSNTWALIGLFDFALLFFLVFVVYARLPQFLHKKYISFRTFLIVSSVMALAVTLLLCFDIPAILFDSKFFTSFLYATNALFGSVGHLTIIVAFVFSSACLFYFSVNTTSVSRRLKGFLLQAVFVTVSFILLYVIVGIIRDSSMKITLLQFKNISLTAIWLHLLVFVLGLSQIMLFFKSHLWAYRKAKLGVAMVYDALLIILGCIPVALLSPDHVLMVFISQIALTGGYYIGFHWLKMRQLVNLSLWNSLVFVIYFVVNSFVVSALARSQKYQTLAENIAINNNLENGRMIEVWLKELDKQLVKDSQLKNMLNKGEANIQISEYVNKKYLRGFWNNYVVRIKTGETDRLKADLISDYIRNLGSKIERTHFYTIAPNEKNMNYIGVFTFPRDVDSSKMYLEFYPRSTFKSYSFPDLLLSSAVSVEKQMGVSIARYEFKRLTYAPEGSDYPESSDWIKSNEKIFFKTKLANHDHYVYSCGNDAYVVITDGQSSDWYSFLVYLTYAYLVFLLFCGSILWVYLLYIKKKYRKIGLTVKFQLSFVALLLLSFMGILFVSIKYIKDKYKQEQLAHIENKKAYIQKALQDKYYWNDSIGKPAVASLSLDLQDLSYTYQTDIFIYDTKGMLLCSSQPLIFSQGLLSDRIAPAQFFSHDSNKEIYESIAKLNYLTGYAPLINGDYLQLGYIAIPQFYSEDEIKTEIENFISVVVHIYLIITILAVLISIFIGRQIAAPLILIENKLKGMRLGKGNEKIDYTLNDEIGRLVNQYNKTLDQLESSVRQLAKSERETAWKSMARQIAHEINNPLTPMKLTIQQLLRTKKLNDERFDSYFDKSAKMLIEQIDNLSNIAGAFSNFAKMPEAKLEKVDVVSKLRLATELFASSQEQIQITFESSSPQIFVYADPEQLVQVFNNLLKNAIQAIGDSPDGSVKASVNAHLGQVEILIADNGQGIKEELKDKIFAPNFTTKSTGMGLGLAICKNIIETSGGTIDFESIEQEGTTFVIRLPKE